MKITKHILNISQFSVLCVVSALTVWAQGAGAIIKGTVKDPSAAVIPNAAVHVTGGGQTRDAKTDNNGQFTVAIPPGQYEVRVSAPGFVDADQQNVSVTNGQTNPLDISMQITTAAQQVDVNSSGVGTVSVDPSANAGAIVLSEQDLDSLP